MDKKPTTLDLYEAIVEKFAGPVEDFHFLDHYLESLPLDAHILDAGCGTGVITERISEKGYQVIGIDPSSKLIATAKKLYPQIRFYTMPTAETDFDDESFDAVILASTLTQIPSDKTFPLLQEIGRILTPDGLVLISVHHGEPDHTIEVTNGEKMFVNFYTNERLFSVVEHAGFQVVGYEEKTIPKENEKSEKILYAIVQKTSK